MSRTYKDRGKKSIIKKTDRLQHLWEEALDLFNDGIDLGNRSRTKIKI